MTKRVTVKQAMDMAAEYIRDGNSEKAASLYRQLLRMQPDNAVVQQALDELSVDLNKTGFSADTHQLLELYGTGRLDEAKTEAERLAGLYPEQPLPHNIKGAICLAQGAAEQAIACIETAVELAPDYADAWTNLGNAQFEVGSDVDAVTSFRKALELDQSPAQVVAASRGLGKALATLGQFSDARGAFERVLSLQPKDSVTRIALGMALRERGLMLASIAELEQALEYDPESSLGHLELGLSLWRRSRDEKALEHLKRGIELDSENASGYRYLGRFYIKTGDKALAAQALRRSLELEPGSAETQHFLNALEGTTSEIAPSEYVEKLFDDYSTRFEKNLVSNLKYCGPGVLAGMVREYGSEKFGSVADLGCGTGLMGLELRDSADFLFGIDLSPKMLDKAREKGVYDELAQGDIVNVLSASKANYDLVVSTDVLIYIGDLLPLMQAVAGKVSPGGLLAVTTELYPEPNDYQLLETGRYAHGQDYVSRVAAEAGWALHRYEAARLRQEAGEWLTGGFYLFTRAGHH
jgi:predicted TPR repeat methyltransferase